MFNPESSRSATGHNPDRREFLKTSVSCAAHLALLAAAAPARAASVFGHAFGGVSAQEPWGRIQSVADGVWALISTPLEDRTTLCNGGIIQGSSGVLVIESCAGPQGASWLAAQARSLTGRWPDRVVLTHYHGDHTGGIAGFARPDGSPSILATAATRHLVARQDGQRDPPPAAERRAMLAGATILADSAPTTIDLGDREVRIVPREGHTASDVTVEVDDPSVVFCGDLVWNRMFPNYVDAVPSRLTTHVRSLVRGRTTRYVPGHGPMADGADIGRYLSLLDSVEAAARMARENGLSAPDAATQYSVPEPLGEWMLFSPRYYEVAISAWLRELAG